MPAAWWTMELRQLQYFIATAEELHFRKAAETVHVAQPALSHGIQQLEGELGVRLFDRNNRKVVLTCAGKVFYDRARMLVASAERARHEAQSMGRGDAGTITIGFVSTAATRVMPAILGHFKNRIPSADIRLLELTPEEEMDALHRGRIDVALTIAQVLDDDLRVATLCRRKLVAALPDTGAFRALDLAVLRDLAGQTLIVPEPHSRLGIYETILDAYRAQGVKPARTQYVRLIQTSLMLVEAGLGIALVPESFADFLTRGIIYRPLQEPAPEIAITAVWRTDDPSPLLHKFVQDCILTYSETARNSAGPV
jgi:DNA-binding transcriptional LysR family regulator